MKVSKLKVIGLSLLCGSIFATIGCSDMMNKLGDVYWSATYKVRHMAPKVISPSEISSTEWEVIKTETKPNAVHGEPTEAAYLADLTGFTPKTDEIVQASSVNGDGSTVIDVKYDRNKVKITFDLNGGKGKNDEDVDVEELTKDVYVGASDSFPIPVLSTSEVVSGGSFYDWREITDENPRGVKQDNVVNDLTTRMVRYTVPTVDTIYRARWIVQSKLGEFDDTTTASSLPSGKIELQGTANSSSLSSLRTTLTKEADGKEFELDFSYVTSENNTNPLRFSFEGSSTEAAIPALTKVILPNCNVALGWNAFAQCENLESITIPVATTLDPVHGGAAFWGSTKLLFDVASNHESLVASGDKKALFWKEGEHPSFSEGTENGPYSGYVLAAYPSATGKVDLRNFGYEITALGARAMFHAKGVTEIHVPATVKKIETSALLVEEGANTKLFMYSSEPPILIDTIDDGEDDVSAFGSSISTIYVPDSSVETYQESWSTYYEKICPISDYKGN